MTNGRMKSATFLAAMVAALAGSAEKLTIVENGKSGYVIALAADDGAAAVSREAADALVKYIRESTGAVLPIVREDEVGVRPAFYLGRTKKGETVGVPYAELKEYVNCRKIVGRDVFLAGCDDSVGLDGPLQYHDREYLGILEGINTHVKDLSYRRLHGTLKATLGWLEGENVVQFLLPGEKGRNVVPHSTLKVDGSLDWTGASAFQYSNGRCYGDLHTTVALGHLDIPQYKHWGGHTLPVAVPRSKYEKTHPEYFILKGGVRRPDYGPANGGHHCVSNPEVQELVLAELKRQRARGYRWIQLGPTDGQVPCECEKCKALHPDPCERQWLCYKEICEKALKEIPDAKIVVLSYGLSRFAPKSFDLMPPNVIVELCVWSDFAGKFADWARFKSVPKLSYVYFFGNYHSWALAPTRTPRYLAKNMRILSENNVTDIFKCGWADDIGLDGPVCYVFSRLLEDPFRNEEKLLDEFCERAYAGASEPMKKFFRAMYANMDTPRGESVIDVMKQAPQQPERMFDAAYRPPVLNYMAHMLRDAERKTGGDPKVKARLALVRRSFEFLCMRAKCYALSDAWSATHDPRVLDISEGVFRARENMLDAWYDEKGSMKPLDGFCWSYFCGRPKRVVVGGGGDICPSFPELFRYGPNSIWQLRKMGEAKPDAPKIAIPGCEHLEVFGNYARAILDGRTLSRADVNVPCGRDNDLPGIAKRITAFRDKYAAYLVRGQRIGDFVPKEPDDVFGAFWRDKSGSRIAAFIANATIASQTTSFNFPGSTAIIHATVSPCDIAVVYAE